MSVDKVLRDMVADEVARALGPVHSALAELQGNGAVIARLAAALGQTAKRSAATVVRVGAKRGRKAAAARDCAVIDCGEPSRSRGYCNNHYQKFNMLKRTHRLPADWVADAAPNSVKNIVLPRGRAGSQALASARRK